MQKTILTYGIISGVIYILLVVSLIWMSGGTDFDKGNSLGYIFNIGALTMVFLAIRSFREKNGAGFITFNTGFRIGILVTVIGSLIYALAWLVYIYTIDPDFTERYAGFFVEKIRSSGKTVAEIESEIRAFERNMADFSNPFAYALYSFLEVFPGGLIVTILCALLMKRGKPETGQVNEEPGN